eukprot:symbB.v1.2.001325.t1/scaffold57.1/size370615/34
MYMGNAGIHNNPARRSSSERDMPGLTPQGLSNTMWAVAVLVFQSDLVEGLKPQLVRAAPRLNPQELSNVAWTFATLRICSGEVCDAGMKKLPEFVTWHDPIVDAIAKLSMERLDRQLESENSVVNCLALVEALRTTGKLEDSYLDSVLKALLRRADAMDEESLLQPPAELTIRLAELETKVVSEPRALSASLPELYALWKPPGWSAASESDEITTSTSQKPLALRTWLQENFGHRPITHDESVTYGLVHRLDRFTSGVLLWAPCYRGLFAARKVQKEYLCLASGVLKAPIAESSSELGVARMYISPIGRSAFTEVLDSVTLVDPDGHLLSLFDSHPALVCLRVQAAKSQGRTHQIRVHMAHEGHPLVGDPVYGGITPSWHWLHAWKLGLQMTSAPVTVEVPVPMDLRRILERWALTSVDHWVRITFESICAGCNLQISVMLSGFDNGSSVAATETQSKNSSAMAMPQHWAEKSCTHRGDICSAILSDLGLVAGTLVRRLQLEAF